MKRCFSRLLAFVCLLSILCSFTACVDRSAPIFETENISRISFYTIPHSDVAIDVPEEHMEEITAWLGTFKPGKRFTGSALPPGSNSISVEIEYTDGRIVKNGLSTIIIDGKEYFINHEYEPECYFAILESAEY